MANEDETSGGPAERTLEFTPTWALTSVAIVFIVISLAVERLLHSLANYLQETNRKPLLAALRKMKDELMLMGFISLTITILQDSVTKICVPSSDYDKWTPCEISKRPGASDSEAPASSRRRLLASDSAPNTCQPGHEPFITANMIHQLHIFIVVLALVHVVYTCLTMLCALFRVYRWRTWEMEAHQAATETRIPDLIENISLSRQSTFVRYHTSEPWSRSRLVVWVMCFFQQFYIPRADYMALRLSFINTHNLKDTYDFHSYMVRTLEDEFETIVGISAWLWGCVVAMWLLNVDKAHLYVWTSLIPPIVVFIIGTKLQHVIATLALENVDVPGPLVPVAIKPRDQLFWFNRPKLLLSAIHLILFEIAFEFATFFWHVWQFGYNTCLMESNKMYLWGRLTIGLVVLLFTSYSTLPLYALVTQMGSNYKKAVLSKNVERVLLKWHKGAKQRVKASSTTSDTSRAPPSSSSLILHFKSRIADRRPSFSSSGLGMPSSSSSSSSCVKESAGAQALGEHVPMEEGTLTSVIERPTAEHIWGRPRNLGLPIWGRPSNLELPIWGRPSNLGLPLPGSLRANHSGNNNEEKPTTIASPTSRPTTHSRPTFQEVQYLPPHPAFNHRHTGAVLQRQNSAPSFEIQRDYS